MSHGRPLGDVYTIKMDLSCLSSPSGGPLPDPSPGRFTCPICGMRYPTKALHDRDGGDCTKMLSRVSRQKRSMSG